MKLINVSTKTHPNCFAKVDDEDYAYLTSFGKWTAHRPKKNGTIYAIKASYGKKQLAMHRLVLEARRIDHADGDGLNNQKCNLRAATAAQNSQNRAINCGSRFKGVSWYDRHKQWVARIGIGGKSKFLGLFRHQEDAAEAYDAAAVLHFGEFARLNFASLKILASAESPQSPDPPLSTVQNRHPESVS